MRNYVLSLVLVSILITQSEQSMISFVVDKVLSDILAGKTIIQDIPLGGEKNKLLNVKVAESDYSEKSVKSFGSLGIKLNLNLTNVLVAGNYDFDNMDILSMFSIFGKGNFSFNLKGLCVTFHVRAEKDFITEKYNVDLKALFLGIQNTTIVFENLMDDPKLADFINKILSGSLPFLINSFFVNDSLTSLLKPTVEHLYSGVLFCIETEGLSGQLEECIRNINLSSKLVNLNRTFLLNNVNS